jgi:hypothetical protein
MHREKYAESSSLPIIRTPRAESLQPCRWLQSLVLPLLTLLIASSLWAQDKKPSTPTTAVPTTFFGISINSNNHHYPPSGTNFGLLRLWDTPGTSWPDLQASSTSSLTTTNLDTVLEDACKNSPGYVSGTTCGDAVVMYTFGRIPYWATSDTTDTTCAYYNSTLWNTTTHLPLTAAPGQCDPPSDLFNSMSEGDGSGTDAHWRAFITALATHLSGLSTTTYAPVVYFETWNEVDRGSLLDGDSSNVSYGGTYAQLLRMTEDMRCIFLGTGTIHNYPTAGTSTACSSTTWTGQSVGIFTSAKIVSPSAHAQGSTYLKATSVEKNFLHCDAASPYAPPADTYCNWGPNNSQGNWGSAAVDIINFHMKPGNEDSSTDPEGEMATEYSNATAVIESGDPTTLWNGESGYSGSAPCGWTPPMGGDTDLNSEAVQQAAFLARYFLIQWSLGIQNNDWYQYDNSNFLEGSCSGGVYTSNGTTTDAYTAYNTVATWMSGSTMSSIPGTGAGCQLVGGTTYPTLWGCKLTQGTWTGEVFWDTSSSYSCSTGTCTTYSYDVGGSGWTGYETALGGTGTVHSPHYPINVSNLPTIIMTGAPPNAFK